VYPCSNSVHTCNSAYHWYPNERGPDGRNSVILDLGLGLHIRG
jgi:hypothetical protein